jgi:hypothetical protein
MLLLYAIAIGLVCGLALGGRPGHLGRVHIRWAPVALAGLLFQAALFSPPIASRVGDAGPALYVASTVLVLAALLRNLPIPGFAVIAVGAVLNLTAIVANGGRMPASPEAFTALTGQPAVPTTDFSNSVITAHDTQLAFLGDIFVLPRPIPLANVFSIGDVVIALGAAVFFVVAMRGTVPARAAAHG